MSSRRRTALALLAAFLGVVIAAAITYGTSQLVRQHIGLASEPLTAGRTLLPATASAPAKHRAAASTPKRAPSVKAPPASAPASRSTAQPAQPAPATTAPEAPRQVAPSTSGERPAAGAPAPRSSEPTTVETQEAARTRSGGGQNSGQTTREAADTHTHADD